MRIFRPKKVLKILFVATEAEPFAKVGGLGAVMYSLPKSLVEVGHDARVMIPRYLSIDTEVHHLKMQKEGLTVPTGNEKPGADIICNVKRFDPKAGVSPIITYFLENQEYFEQRANVYGYADDAVRWSLLCRGVLEFLRTDTSWTPDIIVSSDWQTGIIPNLLKTTYKQDPILSGISTVFSIHNLFYQAMFDHKFVMEGDRDDGTWPVPGMNDDALDKVNWMRRGIMYADVINTVSPNYAREIMTKDFGEMLDDLIRERRAVVSGILNGTDYGLWDPKTDAAISTRYSISSIEKRAQNKIALQQRFNLPVSKDKFLIAAFGRMSKQKGYDLMFPVIERLIEELPIQMVVVGDGEGDIKGFFQGLAAKYPDKVGTHLKYDSVLPHLIFAGADVLVIPSRFEPCGLTQMEAMRMGAVPIVRKTGGLADSVEDYNPEKATGTGFVFEKFDSSSLMIAIIRAFENFRDKKKWRALQVRAMKKDFSWTSSAEKYVELFKRAIEIHTNY